MSDLEFIPFPKIPRLRRTIIVTEKIDGTNAVTHISNAGEIQAGSRTRWITPERDNFGFAAWVRDNKDELLKLGPGLHYGEWWGQGIQRKYGLDHRRFSLFNVARWDDPTVRPECCHVVPTLYRGPYGDDAVRSALDGLREHGSAAAPGFMGSEGVVIFHIAGGHLYKVALEHDEEPKSKAAAA